MKSHKLQLTAVVLVLALAVGCTAAWIQTAINDAPVVIQIVTSIMQIASTATTAITPGDAVVAQTVANEAVADLKTAQALINNYQSAPASAQPGILNQIDAALQAAQSNMAQILTDLHIKDPALQAEISGGIGIAIGTVEAMATLIPKPPTAGKRAVQPVKPMAPKQLKAAFNAVVAVRNPEAVIH